MTPHLCAASLSRVPTPPCPYCGEPQAYREARPSHPQVITLDGQRETVYGTACRACGERICFRFGPSYYWSTP